MNICKLHTNNQNTRAKIKQVTFGNKRNCNNFMGSKLHV